MTTYTPGQLARVLWIPEPTAEQVAVIGAGLGPLAVIAGERNFRDGGHRAVALLRRGLPRQKRGDGKRGGEHQRLTHGEGRHSATTPAGAVSRLNAAANRARV